MKPNHHLPNMSKSEDIHQISSDTNKNNVGSTTKSPNPSPDKSESESASGDSGHFSLSPNHLSTVDPTITPESVECVEVLTSNNELSSPSTVRKRLDFCSDALLRYESSDNSENSDNELDSVDNEDDNKTIQNKDLDEDNCFFSNDDGLEDVTYNVSKICDHNALINDVTDKEKDIGSCEIKRNEAKVDDHKITEDVDADKILKGDEVNEPCEINEKSAEVKDYSYIHNVDNDVVSFSRTNFDSKQTNHSIDNVPESISTNKTIENNEKLNAELSGQTTQIDNGQGQSLETSTLAGDRVNTYDVTKEFSAHGDESQSSDDNQQRKHHVIGCDDSALANQNAFSSAVEENAIKESDVRECQSPIPRFHSPQRKKLKRTQYSREDLQQLNLNFQQNPWLSPEKQERLAANMGYTDTQIKTWFQNKRASIFGSRKPKKRPLRELCFNQPLCPQNLLPQQHQQQNVLHPYFNISPHPLQHIEHSQAKMKRKENSEGVESLLGKGENQNNTHTFSTTSTLPNSETFRDFPTLSSTVPLPSTSLSLHNHPQPNVFGNSQQHSLVNKPGTLHDRGVHFGWNATNPSLNTPLRQDPTTFPTPFPHHFPLQYPKPIEATPPSQPAIAPMAYAPGYTPYPLPMPYHPGLFQPTLWAHPFYSHFHPGTGSAFPAFYEHRAAILRNRENSFHHTLPSRHNRTSPSSSINSSPDNLTVSATRGSGSIATGKHDEQTPCNSHFNIDYPNQNLIHTQNQNDLIRGLNTQHVISHASENDIRQQRHREQPPAPSFSTFMEEFADRLHKSSKKANNADDNHPTPNKPEPSLEKATNSLLPDRVSSTCSPPVEDEINVD